MVQAKMRIEPPGGLDEDVGWWTHLRPPPGLEALSVKPPPSPITAPSLPDGYAAYDPRRHSVGFGFGPNRPSNERRHSVAHHPVAGPPVAGPHVTGHFAAGRDHGIPRDDEFMYRLGEMMVLETDEHRSVMPWAVEWARKILDKAARQGMLEGQVQQARAEIEPDIVEADIEANIKPGTRTHMEAEEAETEPLAEHEAGMDAQSQTPAMWPWTPPPVPAQPLGPAYRPGPWFPDAPRRPHDLFDDRRFSAPAHGPPRSYAATAAASTSRRRSEPPSQGQLPYSHDMSARQNSAPFCYPIDEDEGDDDDALGGNQKSLTSPAPRPWAPHNLLPDRKVADGSAGPTSHSCPSMAQQLRTLVAMADGRIAEEEGSPKADQERVGLETDKEGYLVAPPGTVVEGFVSRYVIQSDCGRGSHASVKIALRQNRPGLVAIKVSRVHTAQVGIYLPASDGEASIVGWMMRQPGWSWAGQRIVGMVDQFQINPLHSAYVMDYLEGGSLLEFANLLVGRKLRFDMENLSDIVRQILTGLNWLHGLGICHRDIKHDNILFAERLDFNPSTGKISNPRVKIADFGVAIDLTGRRGRVDYDCAPGSPPFRPPEVWRNRTWSFNRDIWAVGHLALMLYLLQDEWWSDEQSGSVGDKLLGMFRKLHRSNQQAGYPPTDWETDLINRREMVFGNWLQKKTFHHPKFYRFLTITLVLDPYYRASAAAAYGHQWISDGGVE